MDSFASWIQIRIGAWLFELLSFSIFLASVVEDGFNGLLIKARKGILGRHGRVHGVTWWLRRLSRRPEVQGGAHGRREDRDRNDCRPPLPPGPGGLGFDRLLHRIRDGVGFYEHLYRTCGDIVYFRMLSNRFCVVFDPALFQEVFVTKKSSFEVGPIFTRSGLLNDPSSGLTAEGDELKRTRTLARASFRAKAMNGYGEIMIGQTLQAQAGWRDGDTVDLDAEAQTLALDIATNTFFGSDMRVEPRVINDVLKAIEWSMALVLLPLGEWIRTLPLPQNRRCARTIGTLDKALHGATANARRAAGERPDLLSYLVHATDEDGIYEPFNDSELRDLCFILLFAGHETTGTAITWSLYHLSRHPEARERLEKELDEVLGNRPPTAADYRNLTYTRAVLDENLRLTPPLYVTPWKTARSAIITFQRERSCSCAGGSLT